MTFALVIPFHNETSGLPRLIDSIRDQRTQVPVIFVDNASTDGSALIVRNCDEVQRGSWILLEENRIGKRHAIRTAASFAQGRLGVSHVGFVDADSNFANDAWVSNSQEILARAGARCGYSYSWISYYGLDHLPNFRVAYGAYESITTFLASNIGWLANGQAFLCSLDILTEYFNDADVTTEFDLRCSLRALSVGREGFLNSCHMETSPRRMLVNAQQFNAWCFYNRKFYSHKDINSSDKLDLNSSNGIMDLDSSLVDLFFQRRSLKLVSRHLFPFLIFHHKPEMVELVFSHLKVDVSEALAAARRQFSDSKEWLFTGQFEKMIRIIELNPATTALCDRIAAMMRRSYHASVHMETAVVSHAIG
ncbi:MAG: glycosyltransferase family 2 protein [Chthoniobacterales bacterium]